MYGMRRMAAVSERLRFVCAEPAAGRHVDAAVRQKGDALLGEKRALHVRPAENVAGAQGAVLEHDAVAGDAHRVRIAVQYEADAARGPRLARQKRDTAVIVTLPRGIFCTAR